MRHRFLEMTHFFCNVAFLYINTVALKSNNQDVIQMQSLSFTSNGLTNMKQSEV